VKHYSIWLIPQEPLLSDLSTVIDELATSYLAPPFSPHVTLFGSISSLSDVDVEVQTKQLASQVEREREGEGEERDGRGIGEGDRRGRKEMGEG
jgi:Cyclic phosphodiesterase-like protein